MYSLSAAPWDLCGLPLRLWDSPRGAQDFHRRNWHRTKAKGSSDVIDWNAMSRSYRRTPVAGNTTAESDKKFKQRSHRQARVITRQALSAGNEDKLHPKQTGDPWLSNKDGKQWVDRSAYPEVMRK